MKETPIDPEHEERRLQEQQTRRFSRLLWTAFIVFMTAKLAVLLVLALST